MSTGADAATKSAESRQAMGRMLVAECEEENCYDL